MARLFASRAGEAVGRWSYSIYLLQFPVQQFLMFFALYFASTGWVTSTDLFLIAPGARPQLGATRLIGDLTNVVMLGILLAASAATYRLVEAPSRERVRRWVAARRAARDAAGRAAGAT
jgi:peptidoglycan/LPS O-acetylase OafA/YrhL